MIIWSRWGIVVLAFVGLGIALGFLIKSIVGIDATKGAGVGVFIGIGFILSGVLLWVFNRFVVGVHIDKPHAAVMYEKLAEPVRTESGAVQSHRVIPILHPETGQQIMTNPTSTFFFIPLRFWAYILPIIGVAIFVINLVLVISGRN